MFDLVLLHDIYSLHLYRMYLVTYCVSYCLTFIFILFFFFRQNTAYEMRIIDWSSDVCSSDLMRHVHEQQRADLVRNRAEPLEIKETRIGRSASDDQLRLMFDRQRLKRVVIDKMGIAVDAILHGVEPFARKRRLRAVRQMATGIERHAEEGFARFQQRQHHRPVRLRARMRLNVGEWTVEKLPCAIDGQCLDLIRWPAALIITATRIAFGIFVGEDRALRLQHRLADDVFARDQFALLLLALPLMRETRRHGGIGRTKAARAKPGGLALPVTRCGCEAHDRAPFLC